jgi:hypothetical protein
LERAQHLKIFNSQGAERQTKARDNKSRTVKSLRTGNVRVSPEY